MGSRRGSWFCNLTERLMLSWEKSSVGSTVSRFLTVRQGMQCLCSGGERVCEEERVWYRGRGRGLLSTCGRVGSVWIHLAALVATDDLDEAYRLTNNIDWDWTKNSGVECRTDTPRSTSWGDLMLQNGTWYVVDMVGMRELTPKEVKAVGSWLGGEPCQRCTEGRIHNWVDTGHPSGLGRKEVDTGACPACGGSGKRL